MKRNQIFYILLLLLIIDISECLRDDLDGYEVLNYLEEKKYILNKTESDEKMFRLKMDVDKILSSDCLIDIHQIDPQKVYLYYKFEKGGEKEFKNLKNWITTNNYDKHVLNYKIEKPKEKGNTLYLNITVKNFKDKQEFSVESTDSQFNVYLLVILVVSISAGLIFVVVFLSYYCMFKAKTNDNELNDFDIIFAKVGPEDL